MACKKGCSKKSTRAASKSTGRKYACGGKLKK